MARKRKNTAAAATITPAMELADVALNKQRRLQTIYKETTSLLRQLSLPHEALRVDELRVERSVRPRGRAERYFLQFAEVESPADLHRLSRKLSAVGKVVDCGYGTASESGAGWVEIDICADDAGAVLAKLDEADLSRENLEKVVVIEPGAGRTCARNLELFASENGREGKND